MPVMTLVHPLLLLTRIKGDDMNAYSRPWRAGRLTAALAMLAPTEREPLSLNTRRCHTAEDASDPLDDEQLMQVTGGLDSPWLPGEDWEFQR